MVLIVSKGASKVLEQPAASADAAELLIPFIVADFVFGIGRDSEAHCYFVAGVMCARAAGALVEALTAAAFDKWANTVSDIRMKIMCTIRLYGILLIF
jgi:hypothetical protein